LAAKYPPKVKGRHLVIRHINRYIRLLFISLLVTVACFYTDAASPSDPKKPPKTIKIVMDNNYPPYVFLDGKGNLQGILIDQWRLWEQKTGVRADISGMDWGEALRRMEAEEFDVIDTIFFNERRAKIYDFSKPYAKIDVSIFFHMNISGISDANSLQGFAVAVKSGDNAIDHLRKKGITLFQEYPSYEAIIRDAKENKVMVAVIDNPPALYFLYKIGILDQFRYSEPLYTGEFHRAVKKGNTAILKSVEEGFAQISESEYQAINRKWFGTETSVFRPYRRHIITGVGALVVIILFLIVWNRTLRKKVSERTLRLEEEIAQNVKKTGALQVSEAKYRSLFENSVEGIFQTTPEGRFISANPALAKLFGYDSSQELMEEITDIGRQHYVNLQDRETYRNIIETEGIVEGYEVQLLNKDGKPVWASLNARAVRDDEGSVIYYEGTLENITERKRAQEEIIRERMKLQTLSDNAPFGMAFIDKENHFTYINSKFTEQFGFDLSDIPDGRTWFRKAFPNTEYRHTVIAAWIEDFRDAGPGEQKPRVFTVTCKDGAQKIVNFIPSMLTSGDYLMTCENITDRKRLEAQLIQAQKMEAVGTLAGGVAHDFNNLLMGIQGYASLMMLELDPHHPHYEGLKHIEEQVKSAADLTKQLLGFARGGRYEMRPVNINEIIRKTSSMFGRTRKELTIHEKYENDLWTVEADQSQIEQVLLNLYVNAWHAMPSGGELYLETINVTHDESNSTPYVMPSGNYIKISVTDTGMGMDEMTRKRIFEPFFTTKEMGRGTGLGLAMVYGIMKGHKGFINVYSEPGHGATFTLYFPASEKKALGEKPASREILRGSETILLVDDEPSVLAVSKAILESLGYTVYELKSGQEAIAFYKEKKDTISLVILDMVMPGLSGGETFDRIRGLNPSAKIILVSGYSLNSQAQHIMDRGCHGFIQKPFNITHISQKIREVLDS
jgi:PAS domain S-box-containing protein